MIKLVIIGALRRVEEDKVPLEIKWLLTKLKSLVPI